MSLFHLSSPTAIHYEGEDDLIWDFVCTDSSEKDMVAAFWVFLAVKMIESVPFLLHSHCQCQGMSLMPTCPIGCMQSRTDTKTRKMPGTLIKGNHGKESSE